MLAWTSWVAFLRVAEIHSIQIMKKDQDGEEWKGAVSDTNKFMGRKC